MPRRPARPFPVPMPLLLPVLVCAGIEVALLGADAGFWGSPRWRPLTYQYGAFWAGLWHGWQPNYALQPWTMLVTYAWLHAGPGHLVGNVLGLLWFGHAALGRLGQLRLAALTTAAALGGGLAFGLLTTSPAPMVGASGAVFGLAAALILWRAQDARAAGTARGRAWGRAALLYLGLGLANAAMWAAAEGNLAWETHLGGALAGALAAAALGQGRGRAPR